MNSPLQSAAQTV